MSRPASFWAAAHVFPGILIGEGLAFAGELSGRLMVVLLVLLVILALVGYAIRLAAAGVSPYLNHLLNRVSAWARRKPGRSWQRFARAVAPENPRSVAIVFFAAIVFTGLVAIANLAIRAASADAMSNMDISIFTLMREMRNAPADEIMIVITMLGDTLVMAALAVTIIGWLIWRKAYRAAYAAAFAIVAAKLFEMAVKFGIQRARPLELAYSGVERLQLSLGPRHHGGRHLRHSRGAGQPFDGPLEQGGGLWHSAPSSWWPSPIRASISAPIGCRTCWRGCFSAP